MTDDSHVANRRPSTSHSPRAIGKVVAVGSLMVAGVLVVAVSTEVDGGALRSALVGPLDALGAPIDVLQAAPVVGNDFDGDGLSDKQEVVLGTYAYFADSDGDGYEDGEEIARQSDPLDAASIPLTEGISASITARGEDADLRLVMCIHEPVDELDEAIVRFGALRSGMIVSVPLARLLGFADVSIVDGSDDSRITTIELPLNPAFVHSAGRVTFFIAVGNENTLTYGSAAKIDVTSTDNILLLQRVSFAQAQVQAAQGGGSIRQPIPSGFAPNIPASWTAGAICFQRSTVVGGAGPIMLHQVVEADCLQGWDTYCASDCSSAVGSTYETIDPAALIGG